MIIWLGAITAVALADELGIHETQLEKQTTSWSGMNFSKGTVHKEPPFPINFIERNSRRGFVLFEKKNVSPFLDKEVWE